MPITVAVIEERLDRASREVVIPDLGFALPTARRIMAGSKTNPKGRVKTPRANGQRQAIARCVNESDIADSSRPVAEDSEYQPSTAALETRMTRSSADASHGNEKDYVGSKPSKSTFKATRKTKQAVLNAWYANDSDGEEEEFKTDDSEWEPPKAASKTATQGPSKVVSKRTGKAGITVGNRKRKAKSNADSDHGMRKKKYQRKANKQEDTGSSESDSSDSSDTSPEKKPARKPKPRIPKSAYVPLPKIDTLTNALPAMKSFHSGRVLEDLETRRFQYYAKNWAENVTIFTLPDADLETLRARPKPSKKFKELAEKEMERMEEWPSDPFSGIWEDCHGQPMVAVFSWRLKSDNMGCKPASPTDNPTKILNEANSTDDKAVANDGTTASNNHVLKSSKSRNKRKKKKADVDYHLGPGGCTKKEVVHVTGPKGHPGRTEANFMSTKESDRIRDGFQERHLVRFEEATQILHAFVHPHSDERDARHGEHETMINLTLQHEASLSQVETVLEASVPPEYIRAPLQPGLPQGPETYCSEVPFYDPKEPQIFERVGVTHLVHGWETQGHKGNFTVSTDFARNMTGAMAVRYYFKATPSMARRLAAMFEVAFPEYYKKYCQAFEAGIWETQDPGPWLGRAIVWKMQVLMHRDGLDHGPAATFPMGYFLGGKMYFPDLGLKLTYLRSRRCDHQLSRSLVSCCGQVGARLVAWPMQLSYHPRQDSPCFFLPSTII